MGTITVKLGTGEEHVLPWNDESTLAVVNISRPDPWNKFEARHAFSDVASVKINVKADAPDTADGGAEVAGGEGEAQPEPQKKPKSARRPKAKP